MTVKDLFGLAVRIAGVVFVVFGLFDLVDVFVKLMGLPMPSRYPAATDAVAAIIFFIFGAIFILGADLITRLIYRRAP
jgi:hypothetical protein